MIRAILRRQVSKRDGAFLVFCFHSTFNHHTSRSIGFQVNLSRFGAALAEENQLDEFCGSILWELPVIFSANERETMSNARATAPIEWGKCGTYGERK